MLLPSVFAGRCMIMTASSLKYSLFCGEEYVLSGQALSGRAGNLPSSPVILSNTLR